MRAIRVAWAASGLLLVGVMLPSALQDGHGQAARIDLHPGIGPGAPSVARPAPAEGGSNPAPQAVLYRWRDRFGTVHIHSSRPVDRRDFEVIAVGGAAGPSSALRPAPRTGEQPPNARRPAADPLSVHTPEGFAALARQAAWTRTHLSERARLLEYLAEQL